MIENSIKNFKIKFKKLKKALFIPVTLKLDERLHKLMLKDRKNIFFARLLSPYPPIN